MQIHELTQGSPEWLAYRANHFNASDSPAMMGVSEYKTRTQLLHELHTGMTPDTDPATQRRFDEGHRIEALARPLAEEFIGQELYPVTGSEGRLSASFDGLTIDDRIDYEHKTLNENLRAIMVEGCTGAHLDMQYQVQMEQQLLVSGAEKCLFMASKWNGDELIEERHCWYMPNLELRASIVSGWAQFAIDLATYVSAEVVIAPVAKPQMSLPAVSIRVNGSIALVDNLQAFGTALTAYVERINKEPETDQDFADLEATVKTLKNAEEALEAAENGALAQTESIDSMRRTVGLYRETARTNRLLVEKLVKVEKENRRTKIIGDAVAAFHTHMRGLNERLGKPYMPAIQGEFQQVVKGLKSLDSMKDKVANELARCKIESNATSDKIQTNLNTLRELAANHAFLFSDTSAIVLKANDDLVALVKSRIADHKAIEEKKEAEQRERIRAEEVARLEREQAELDRMTAKRVSEEAIVKAQEFTQKLVPAAVVAALIATETVAVKAPVCDSVQVANSGKPAASTAPDLRLGQITERLGFALTADFLRTLGFEPAGRDRAAVPYHEADFPRICAALVRRINSACELLAA